MAKHKSGELRCPATALILLTFKVKVKGQMSRLRLDGVTYNINNYDQDNVFEKYKTSVIDSKHISTIFDVTFK